MEVPSSITDKEIHNYLSEIKQQLTFTPVSYTHLHLSPFSCLTILIGHSMIGRILSDI